MFAALHIHCTVLPVPRLCSSEASNCRHDDALRHLTCLLPAAHLPARLPAEGQFVRERELCLAGVLQGGQLTYNYTLAEDGCPGPDEYDRWTARSVPTTLLPGVEGDSVDSCP